MRTACVKNLLAALAVTAATLCAQEKLPDASAPLTAQPPATPTRLLERLARHSTGIVRGRGSLLNNSLTRGTYDYL